MTGHNLCRRTGRFIAGAAALLCLPGCLTLQVIEPVIAPPAQFTANVTVPMEFAMPGSIGFRCAERGATFLGLPGINSGACADRQLVTMLDPCLTLTAGPYAAALCDSLREHRSEASTAPPPAPELAPAPRLPRLQPGLIKASFRPVITSVPAPRPASAAPLAERSAWQAVVVEFVDAEAVEFRCAERGAKLSRDPAGLPACADRLMLTAVNPCSSKEQSWYTRTLCHELAHVNGWPSDHPSHAHVIAPASQSPQALLLAAASIPTPLEAASDYARLSAQMDPPSPGAVLAPADIASPASVHSLAPSIFRRLISEFFVLGSHLPGKAPQAVLSDASAIGPMSQPAPETSPEQQSDPAPVSAPGVLHAHLEVRGMSDTAVRSVRPEMARRTFWQRRQDQLRGAVSVQPLSYIAD
jgi:hypothetical protein